MSARQPEQIIETILAARGIGANERASFLQPDFTRDTHSPHLLKGMDVAVQRLMRAREKGERIVIFGDYDADGVPATALLVRALKELGYTDVIPMVPTRAEGYGLTAGGVERILAASPALLVTVDNGTVAREEIAEIQARGVDVIVIDHHESPADHTAEPLALINPKQAGCNYPFRELCACGLAWKVAVALGEACNFDTLQFRWLLDLVALSTVADMVPLVGENRVLTIYGLKVLQKTRNIGLAALLESAGITPPEVDAGTLGFALGPRINAPSRMHLDTYNGEPAALKLLITSDEAEAQQLARYLSQQNADRQHLVDEHLRAAEALAAEQANRQVFVMYDPSWSTGVIGLVAGRLLEAYRRPVIVLASEGDEIKGSVRSTDAVDALAMITAAERVLARFGGHAKAAGLTLSGTVEELHELVEAYVAQVETEEIEERTELPLSLEEATLDLADAVAALGPFGIGFPAPRFCTDVRVKNIRRVGRDSSHLACFLEQDGVQRKAIAFRYKEADPTEGEEMRACYRLEVETWQGVRSVSCALRSLDQIN